MDEFEYYVSEQEEEERLKDMHLALDRSQEWMEQQYKINRELEGWDIF
jgi:hypothetical protein